MLNNYLIIYSQLSGAERFSFMKVISFSIFASLMEVVGLGSVFAFILTITSESSPDQFSALQLIGGWLKIDDTMTLKLIASLCLAFLIIMSAIIRFEYLRFSSKIMFNISARLAKSVFGLKLNESYADFANGSPQETVSLLTTRMNIFVHNSLMTSITLINGCIFTAFIFIFLLAISYSVTLMSLVFFSLVYLLVNSTVKDRLDKAAKKSNQALIAAQRTAASAIEGMLAVKINGYEEIFIQRYAKIEDRLRSSQRQHYLLTFSPKIIIETFAIIFIVVIAAWLFWISTPGETVPLLAVFGLSLQRLLPVTQQIFTSYATIKAYQPIMDDIVSTMSVALKSIQTENLTFHPTSQKQCIVVRNLTLPAYANNINAHNFSINSGEIVRVSGPSGAGKSTLITVLSGLEKPENGNVDIYGFSKDSWLKTIQFVTQDSFLVDEGIIDNIVFGKVDNDIDINFARSLGRDLGLNNLIDEIDGTDRTVGENGKRLSGGQRQRVCLARALYQKPKYLILDEATSALDANSQLQVFETIIDRMQCSTLIYISHDNNLARYATKVIEL